MLSIRFQSTHPMRGATFLMCVYISIQSISIHAPHAGCDAYYGNSHLNYLRFQSTHPMRGATILILELSLKPQISIHAPHAGCDADRVDARALGGISIHAPHAGCDPVSSGRLKYFSYFNPRTPCGVRPHNAV